MYYIVDSVSIQIYSVHKESYRSRPKIINVKHAHKNIVKLTMKDNNILKFCICLSLLCLLFSAMHPESVKSIHFMEGIWTGGQLGEAVNRLKQHGLVVGQVPRAVTTTTILNTTAVFNTIVMVSRG